MKTVRQIAREIVAREGGYVDDPDDPGGATKHGVTIHTLQHLGMDLTGDGKVDRRDVRALSEDQAIAIFLEHYYEKPRIQMLPAAVRPSVFDMYVNAGGQAVKLLQTLLRRMGYDLAVDSVIGPETAQATADAGASDVGLLRDAYGIARRNFYFRLADRRPASRKYVRTRVGGKGGWIKRAEAFVSPKYHLSKVEFEQRISAWD